MFQFYEGDSRLHRMNPGAKLAAVGICMVFLTFSFDPAVPGLLFLMVLGLSKGMAKIPLSAMIKGLLPFLVLGLGFLWMQAAFPRGTDGVLMISLGPIQIYREGLIRGAAMALRVLCYAAYALLFAATTDPTELILSMMQQFKLPPIFGYSILAAYRFFPMYQSEFQILREAHLVRGSAEGSGAGVALRRLKRYAIPLLAQAIRKAERVAIAMEAKGFTGSRSRQYYRVLKVRSGDWWMAAGLILMVPAVMLAAYRMNWLILWRGSLFF